MGCGGGPEEEEVALESGRTPETGLGGVQRSPGLGCLGRVQRPPGHG